MFFGSLENVMQRGVIFTLFQILLLTQYNIFLALHFDIVYIEELHALWFTKHETTNNPDSMENENCEAFCENLTTLPPNEFASVVIYNLQYYMLQYQEHSCRK